MEGNSQLEMVMDEVRQIPEARLAEAYKLVHEFRVGVESFPDEAASWIRFAGCWSDLNNDTFGELQRETAERRTHAFSRRRAVETGAD